MAKKILHISNTDICLDSRIRKELKALSQLNEVEISAFGVPGADGVTGVGELDGAHYQRLPLKSRALKQLPRAVCYFFELIEFTIRAVLAGRDIKPDIVHCHDTFALPSGWILKKITGCRLVYDAHELESNKNAQNAVLSFGTLLIEKVCWKQVDLMVSVSDSITRWYMLNLGMKPNVLVLNSPAIADLARSADPIDEGNNLRVKFGIPDTHLVFVYLGILGAGRGIEICLDAFASGPEEAHVIFVGSGRLESTIATYAARTPNIHFHPAVPHDQVVSLVRSADYGLCLIENVSLSDYYCLPNKLFEYGFARLTVLASDFPEIRRMVELYSLGVCCDPSPASVRTALGHLIGRRPVRPESDLTALSWESQAERLRAAYLRNLMTRFNG